MNQIARPSRPPAPPADTTYADATFTEVERPNNLPARANGAQRVPQEVSAASSAPLAKVYPAKIAKAIIAITRKITPVEKSGWNEFHKYAYPKWEDVLENLAPLIAEQGLIIQQGEVAHGGFERDLIEIGYEFTIVNEDGEVWPDKPLITAICKVRDSKGVLDDKAASKCHTQAAKYMMTSLFKIRVQDMADADSSGEGAAQRQRPQGRRPVPSPTGKLPPHILPVIDGEAPQAWATRFNAFVAKAESSAEIDKWYGANVAIFDKLKAGNFMQVYNDAIDFMDACAAKLNASGPTETHTSSGTPRAPRADPISSGKPASLAIRDTDFPGDKRLPAPAQDEGSIPWALDRKISENDRDWLMTLKEAFEQCTQVEEVAAEQEGIMLPAQSHVPQYVWQKAVDLVAQHIERING